MTWEELYNKNKNRKNQEIDEITDNFIIKANINNLNKTKKKIAIIILTLIILSIIFTFYKSINTMLSTILLITIFLALILFYNSFVIKYDNKNKKLEIYSNAQKMNIEYKNIKNIYIGKTKERIFIKKRDRYWLVILYETPNHEFNDITFSTIFLDQNKIEKVFNKIKLKPAKINYIEKTKIHKAKRYLIKVAVFIFLLILIILTYIFY